MNKIRWKFSERIPSKIRL